MATPALCQKSWGVCLEMEGLIWRLVSNEVQSFSSLLVQLYFYQWNLRVSVSWQPWQLNCCQSPEYKLVSWYILSWIPVSLKIFYINILMVFAANSVHFFFYKTSNHFCHFFPLDYLLYISWIIILHYIHSEYFFPDWVLSLNFMCLLLHRSFIFLCSEM